MFSSFFCVRYLSVFHFGFTPGANTARSEIGKGIDKSHKPCFLKLYKSVVKYMGFMYWFGNSYFGLNSNVTAPGLN